MFVATMSHPESFYLQGFYSRASADFRLVLVQGVELADEKMRHTSSLQCVNK
jgi:hypothetical protein